jgi:hypothetical protein
MKNLVPITSIATIAALLLLAVAASFIDSLPFALIASYVVGFACSASLLAVFIADYSPRSPRPIPIARRELEAAESARWAQGRFDPSFDDQVTVNILSTVGLRDDPATLSLS